MTNKNKNNNKNNEKNDMERFDLGDVLSLPAPTPVGAPYPRDVTGVKGVAAFIRKLYAMVSAEEHPQICWSPEGTSLIVQDPDGLAEHVLGQYFKHNNFSSFIRQLNLYRFSKVTSEARIEFFNDGFRRGQLQLLRHIKRCVKPSATSSSSSSGAPASGRGCEGVHRAETDKVMKELKSLKRQRDQLQADVATLMNVQSATDMQLAEVARENEALRAELSAAVRVHQSMVSTVSTIMELVTSRAPSLALTVPSELSLESLMENTGEAARPAKRQRHLSSILPKEEGSSSFELASPPPSPTRATMVLPTRPLSSVPLRAAGSSPSRPPPPRPSLTIPFSPSTLDSTTTLASSLLPSPSPSSILVSTSSSFFTTTPTSYASMAVSPIGILGALPPAV